MGNLKSDFRYLNFKCPKIPIEKGEHSFRPVFITGKTYFARHVIYNLNIMLNAIFKLILIYHCTLCPKISLNII